MRRFFLCITNADFTACIHKCLIYQMVRLAWLFAAACGGYAKTHASRQQTQADDLSLKPLSSAVNLSQAPSLVRYNTNDSGNYNAQTLKTEKLNYSDLLTSQNESVQQKRAAALFISVQSGSKRAVDAEQPAERQIVLRCRYGTHKHWKIYTHMQRTCNSECWF